MDTVAIGEPYLPTYRFLEIPANAKRGHAKPVHWRLLPKTLNTITRASLKRWYKDRRLRWNSDEARLVR